MPPLALPIMSARLSPRLASHHHAQHILSRPRQQFQPQHTSLIPLASVRSSSMSAIVRGLRRTFRDPDGRRPPGYNPEVAAHVTRRRQQREAADKPAFRLFRGKKEVTEPAVPKAKTRRARFFDPEEGYGKKSLVYQAKTGKLAADVKSLRRQLGVDEDRQSSLREPEDSRSFRRDDGGRSGHSGRDTRRTGGSSIGRRRDAGYRQGATGWQDRGGDRGDDRKDYDRRDRDTDRRPSNRGDAFEKQLDTRHEGQRGREQRPDRDEGRERSYNQDRGRSGRDGGRESRRDEPALPPVPLSIPYTTAASQFLYGKSVVQAALRSGRRRPYKLYIYNGANRGSAPKDQHLSQTIERLAERAGATVQLVDERWQRLLDKMSRGRPHNGYVLEASPLPQQPLAALGPLTTNDESAAVRGPGFQVELGHQSREEANVNGTSTFVPVDVSMAAHHRPLVLLLDQLLDPGNLGAILRSASFLGVSAVAVSKHSSATLTAVSLKASAGAAEVVELFSVETPTTFLAQSRRAGWKVYAAVPPPANLDAISAQRVAGHTRKPVLDLDGIEAADPLKTDPIILVIGSEGEGLSRAIRREADVEVTIANRSGSNVVDSLNVSVAAGLLCASFLRGATRGASEQETVPVAAVEETPTEAPVEEAVEERHEERADDATARDELNIF